jgi:hypothetical protein
MKTKDFLKALMVTSLVLCFLIVGDISAVYAGGPEPPEGSCKGGPRIVGVLTLTDNGDLTLNGTFRGRCRNEIVKKNICGFEYFVAENQTFADITKNHLLEFTLLGFGPQDCRSFCGGEDLIINKVHTFRNTGTKITATVELLYLLYGGDCPQTEAY